MRRPRTPLAIAGVVGLAASCAPVEPAPAPAPPLTPADASLASPAPPPSPQPSAPPAAPTECGAASYYADSLAGGSTASGEPYDPALATAAHRTLPFGTVLRVTREGAGSAQVVVNDRGPYADDRLIDVSRAAAEALDLITDGVGEVCITVVAP